MLDYKNSKIYKLVSDKTEDIYYGSTVQPLEIRFRRHKSFYNVNKNYCPSFEVLKYNDCKIILVKNFKCSSKKELTKELYKIIKNNNCCNLTSKVWIKKREEYIKYYKKYFYNDIQLIETDNENKILCKCGKKYKINNKTNHLKTKFHKLNV